MHGCSNIPANSRNPGSRCVGRLRGEDIEAFCKELSHRPRRHAVVINDIWHDVFCFVKPEDAAAFREHFGGVTFDPKRRGRGHHWLHYDAELEGKRP